MPYWQMLNTTKDLQKFDEFINEQQSAALNENFMDVQRAIDPELTKFLIDVVIAKSKGYVKNE